MSKLVLDALVRSAYTELEYITTNHDAYIQTNLTVNDFDRVTARVRLLDYQVESENNTPKLFGSKKTTDGHIIGKDFYFSRLSDNSYTGLYGDNHWFHDYPNYVSMTIPLNQMVDYDIKLADGSQYVKINNETKVSGTYSNGNLDNSYPVVIFGENVDGQKRFIPHLNCENITFYLGNTVVANFIPAKRNSDNVAGMYDTVSNTFYPSSSSANFTAGPEVNYTELAYLELQDQAYFNTNVYLSKDMDIEYEFMPTQLDTSGVLALNRSVPSGGFLLSYNINNVIGSDTYNNTNIDFFGNGDRWVVQQVGSSDEGYVLENNKKYKLSIVNKVGSFYKDGTQLDTYTFTTLGESPMTTPLCINATNFQNGQQIAPTYVNGNLHIRFYHFSATGVADIVPVRRNSDNVLGLYNKTTDEFIPKIGSGTLVAGEETGTTYTLFPQYSISKTGIPAIAINLGGITPHSNKKYNLYDRVKTDTVEYTELEYIESSGTQWIILGNNVYLQTGSIIEVDYQITADNPNQPSGWQSIYGNGAGGAPWPGNLLSFAVSIKSGSKGYSYHYAGYNDIRDSTVDTNRHIIRQESEKFYLDGNLKYTRPTSTFTNSDKVCLFSRLGATDLHMYGRIYSAKIWSDGTHLSFNGIPAKRNSDGVLGMYDLVSKEFFTNSGTGTFIAGPDVSTITSSKDIGIVVGFQKDTYDNEYAVVCLNAEYRLEEDEILSKSGDYGTTKYTNQTVWETKETGTYTTQKILDFLASTTGVDGKYTSKSATYFRTLSFSIDNQLYYGQIPNLPEISSIYSRKDRINKEDPSASTHSNLLLPTGNEIKGFGNNALLNSCTQYDSRDIYIIRIHGTVGAIYRELTRGCIGVPILELPNPEL